MGRHVTPDRLGRLLQAAILAVLVAGLLLRSPRLAINAMLGFGVTLLPAVLARDYRILLDTRLALLVTVAVFLHSLGMLALYEQVWWWDHLTHALSAALVATVGYAAVRAFDEYTPGVHLPPRFLTAFTLVLVLALGVLWEVFEFLGRELAVSLGSEPLLVQYGLGDTMLDLVFDAVGALFVVLFRGQRLERVVSTLREGLEEPD